jgi:hypothetical protein
MGFLNPVPANPTSGQAARMSPPRAAIAPVHLYTEQVAIPLSGAQGITTIAADGTGSISVGPTGLGSVWYPASAVISTTTGALDVSTCQVFVGPAGYPTTLQGTLANSGGAGVVALAIPQLTPGLYIIATWAGAVPGDTASLNVTGTAQVISRHP